MEKVILVDSQDKVVGEMEKLAAHQEGVLHRAFSVFVFNSQDQLLLQRRAESKYHSPGLWTNTCCSHPRMGELTESAAHRRLKEEMGFDCPLQFAYSFLYHADLGELVEHELDHVFVGRCNAIVRPDLEEVAEYLYLGLDEIDAMLAVSPESFTAWFQICWPKIQELLQVSKGMAVAFSKK